MDGGLRIAGTGGVSAFAALEGVPEDPSSVVGRPCPAVALPLLFPRKPLRGGVFEGDGGDGDPTMTPASEPRSPSHGVGAGGSAGNGGPVVVGMRNGPRTGLENGSSVGSCVGAAGRGGRTGEKANGGEMMPHNGGGGGDVENGPAAGLERGGGGGGSGGIEGDADGDVPMSLVLALPTAGAVGDVASGDGGGVVAASVNPSCVPGEVVGRRRQLSPTTPTRKNSEDVNCSSPLSNTVSTAEAVGRVTDQSGVVPFRGENGGGVKELVDPAAAPEEKGDGEEEEEEESAYRRPGYIVKMCLTLYKARQRARRVWGV